MECENKCAVEPPKLSVWMITYQVKGLKNYLGIAAVQAFDVKSAEDIFRANSALNAYRIEIQCMKQVGELPCPELLAELYVLKEDDDSNYVIWK